MGSFDSAREAYARYASVYDECNAQNDYETWLGKVLLPELEGHGLRKGWALDAGCGTGRAFDPLLGRGWKIVGGDVSPEMLEEARRKFGRRVRLLQFDARQLPPLDAFPEVPRAGFRLILLLNDVLNYLIEDGDLELVFEGVRRNLDRSGGLAIFDLNSLAYFRGTYGTGVKRGMGAEGWEWCGLADEPRSGAIHEARISGNGVTAHVHRQRHWSPERVVEALEESGLSCLAALGQREERGKILMSDAPDEERDQKIVYIAGHPA